MGVTVRTAYDRPRAEAGVSRWALIDRDDTIGQHQERFAKVVDRLPQRVLIADDRVGDALMCARHPAPSTRRRPPCRRRRALCWMYSLPAYRSIASRGRQPLNMRSQKAIAARLLSDGDMRAV
jgi:hypothetical protein